MVAALLLALGLQAQPQAQPPPLDPTWAERCRAALELTRAAPKGTDIRPLMARLPLPELGGNPGHLAALDEATRRLTVAIDANEVIVVGAVEDLHLL